MRPFRPIIANHHLLTIAGNFWPRRLDTDRYPVEAKLYRTEPDVQVLVQSQRTAAYQAARPADRELGVFQLDWARSFKDARERAAKEKRPERTSHVGEWTLGGRRTSFLSPHLTTKGVDQQQLPEAL